jgi:hypothetical protein
VIRFLLGTFIVAHGLLTAIIWVSPAKPDAPFRATHSWLLGDARPLAVVIALVAAAGFTLAGVGFITQQQISCGTGAKGHRYYDWAFCRLDPARDGQAEQPWLLVRRHQRTGELAFYRCFAPRPVPLAALVRVAGQRWTIEERFQPARAWSAWTPTRCAAGAPGTAGPRWPCCPRLPGGRCRHRPGPRSRATRAGQADLQRGPAPVRRPGRPARR